MISDFEGWFDSFLLVCLTITFFSSFYALLFDLLLLLSIPSFVVVVSLLVSSMVLAFFVFEKQLKGSV